MPDLGDLAINAVGDFVGNVAQAGANYLTNPQTIPSLITAKQQWDQAGNYQKDAERYATQLDPFGSQRPQYQGMLSDIWNDPQAFLNAPAYQTLRMNNAKAAASLLGAQGFGNSGRQLGEVAKNLEGQDWEQIKTMRDQLAHNAGADISPQAAAGILQAGMVGKYNSQNAALAALGRPFTSNGSSFSQGGNPTSGQGSVQKAVSDAVKAGLSPQVANAVLSRFNQLASQFGGQIPGGIEALWRMAVQQTGIDPNSSTGQVLSSIGIDPQTGGGDVGLVTNAGDGFYATTGQYVIIDPTNPDYYSPENQNALLNLNTEAPIETLPDYTGGYGGGSVPYEGFTGGYDDGSIMGGGYTEAINNFFGD